MFHIVISWSVPLGRILVFPSLSKGEEFLCTSVFSSLEARRDTPSVTHLRQSVCLWLQTRLRRVETLPQWLNFQKLFPYGYRLKWKNIHPCETWWNVDCLIKNMPHNHILSQTLVRSLKTETSNFLGWPTLLLKIGEGPPKEFYHTIQNYIYMEVILFV